MTDKPKPRQTMGELLLRAQHQEKWRAKKFPTEDSAVSAIREARQRLLDLGWKEATYCPRNRSVRLLEAGFQPGVGHRDERGRFWMASNDDLWPSNPILWKEIEE